MSVKAPLSAICTIPIVVFSVFSVVSLLPSGSDVLDEPHAETPIIITADNAIAKTLLRLFFILHFSFSLRYILLNLLSVIEDRKNKKSPDKQNAYRGRIYSRCHLVSQTISSASIRYQHILTFNADIRPRLLEILSPRHLPNPFPDNCGTALTPTAAL